MTITQMVQNQQQQRIATLAQRQLGKAHVNQYAYGSIATTDFRSIMNGYYQEIVKLLA